MTATVPITFSYINHRGDFGHRKATPVSFRFGISEYHRQPQWLMTSLDVDKNALREFAMRDMSDVFMPAPIPVNEAMPQVAIDAFKAIRQMTPKEFTALHAHISAGLTALGVKS